MRIMIVDDHALFRKGLTLVLSQLYPEAEILGEKDADSAFDRLEDVQPLDLLLLDLSMPGMAGVVGIRRFVKRCPRTHIVILSASCEPSEVMRAIQYGAHGYILKSATDVVLKNALTLILSGETYIPSIVINNVNKVCNPLPSAISELPANNPLRSLSPRQRDTLALLMEGQSNKEIARNLGLLESTVKAHIKVILHKLNASNRTQAAMIATELGWPRDPGALGLPPHLEATDDR